METFIKQSVTYLYGKYGNDISDLNIVLPSRRGTLFFNMALAEAAGDKPIWQPRFLTMDDIMQRRSGIKPADDLRLLVELYNVYSEFHKEEFEQFYFWGEMVLSDFDMIDNYLVDAHALYTNINDIKEIEKLFGEGTDEKLVRDFWGHMDNSTDSQEKERFLTIWNTLYDIYRKFHSRLEGLGIGYKGMIYRKAAGQQTESNGERYAFIGFNALSKSEMAVLRSLKTTNECEFLWDSDDYYIKEPPSEAGLFLKNNISLFGESNTSAKRDNFRQHKNIRVVASPTDSLTAKYTWQFLEECGGSGPLGTETAVVMTDEALLMPVIHSIPPAVGDFNVTLGYDIRNTEAYSLMEQLISLQSNKKGDKFYHRDIRSILAHTDIIAIAGEEGVATASTYLERLTAENTIFDDARQLADVPVYKEIFTPCDTWRSYAGLFTSVLEKVSRSFGNEATAEKRQFYFTLYSQTAKTRSLFEQCGLEVSGKVFLASLRKVLQRTKVPFDGEPLSGVQVMGILETRNLDFKNVLLLSVEEDNFPSKSAGRSFIPPNLRTGYGLPTIAYHEAMYSYYFYRLLQRAERVDIVYCSGSNGLRSGEPSRYIHQLRYESPHTIDERTISINVSGQNSIGTLPNKDERFREFISKGAVSPTALNNFIECPMKFYFGYVEKLREEDEIPEELDERIIGNLLHDTLESIYRPIVGAAHGKAKEHLRGYNSARIKETIEAEAGKMRLGELFGEEKGNVTLKKKMMAQYIANAISLDLSRNDGFVVELIEDSLYHELETGNGRIKVGGRIDRMDRLPDGSVVIIDYKSGGEKKDKNLDKIFDREARQSNKDLTQILLYATLWEEKHGTKAMPAIYYLRNIKKGTQTPPELLDDFRELITGTLTEFTDLSLPFERTTNKEACKYCPYSILCKL